MSGEWQKKGNYATESSALLAAIVIAMHEQFPGQFVTLRMHPTLFETALRDGAIFPLGDVFKIAGTEYPVRADSSLEPDTMRCEG